MILQIISFVLVQKFDCLQILFILVMSRQPTLPYVLCCMIQFFICWDRKTSDITDIANFLSNLMYCSVS